jgi:hypothetical protein
MRRIGAIAATALAAAVVAMPAAWAQEQFFSTHWAGQTNNAHFRYGSYTTNSNSFLGGRVVVPGDEVSRTLVVRNENSAGTCAAGNFQVSLVDVTEQIPDMAVNTELAQLVQLRWTVAGTSGAATFAQVLDSAQPYPIGDFRLDAGEEGDVTVGVVFAEPEVTGKSQQAESVRLDFDVRVAAQGDCSATPEPRATATPEPSASSTSTSTPEPFPTPSESRGPVGPGAFTGARAFLPPAAMIGLVVVFGVALVRHSRRY